MTAVSCHIAHVTDSQFVFWLECGTVGRVLFLGCAGFMMNRLFTLSANSVVVVVLFFSLKLDKTILESSHMIRCSNPDVMDVLSLSSACYEL